MIIIISIWLLNRKHKRLNIIDIFSLFEALNSEHSFDIQFHLNSDFIFVN